MINRSYVTDLLLHILEPQELDDRVWLVGDHEKPVKGGWQGEAGRSDWVPYVVLTATPSQPPSGSLAKPGGDVWFGYSVTAVGKSRHGADRISSVARERFEALNRQKTDDGRTISRVRVMRYGGLERIPLEPPLYLITDQFMVYTTE